MSAAEPLAAALAELVAAGVAAGIEPDVARNEGERIAAAVAESSPAAATDWLRITGHSGTRTFFEAAASARRWRVAPTDALALLPRGEASDRYTEALLNVASAAATLGEPGPQAANAAIEVAAAQRREPAPPPQWVAAPSASAPAPPSGSLLDLPQFPWSGQGTTALAPEGATGAAPATSARTSDLPQVALAGEPAPEAEVPEEPAPTVAELLAELDALVGLTTVKDQVHRQVELLRVEKLRTEAGLTKPTLTRHLVFVGNPGTGKTTIARLIAKIYKALGLLSSGHLVEVDRSELVAGYLGQTATKTTEVVTSALGGVLFIDEAYALTQGTLGPDQYGQEAVNTLVKDMEDNRDDLVVIVAGYPRPMAEFVATNPGLESRFATTLTFEDYSDEELRAIFELMAAAADFEPTTACLERVEYLTSVQPRTEGFGNARYVRNLLDAAIARHAWRLREVAEPTIEQLRLLLPEDLGPTTEVVQIGSDQPRDEESPMPVESVPPAEPATS